MGNRDGKLRTRVRDEEPKKKKKRERRNWFRNWFSVFGPRLLFFVVFLAGIPQMVTA